MRKILFAFMLFICLPLSANQFHKENYNHEAYGLGPAAEGARIYLYQGHNLDIMTQESCNYAYGSASSRRYLGHLTRDLLQAYGYTRTECEIARLVLWAEYKYVREDGQTEWGWEYPSYHAPVIRNFGQHFEKVLRCHVQMDADKLPTPSFAVTYALALNEFENGITRQGNCPDPVVETPESSTPVGLPAPTTATAS